MPLWGSDAAPIQRANQLLRVAANGAGILDREALFKELALHLHGVAIHWLNDALPPGISFAAM